jgi:hypothetical protein
MRALISRGWRHTKKPTYAADDRGQVLVIVAAGLIGIIAMVGLVIDGGYAWSQQRVTQNAADAAAKAGTVQVQLYLAGGTQVGNDVACAVDESATNNRVEIDPADAAVYTDAFGDPLVPEVLVGDCGSAGPIPSGGQGVKVVTLQEFDTFLARVIGILDLTVRADATAVVAEQVGICPAEAGCGALPVTFPQTVQLCDSTEAIISITDDEDGIWVPWEVLQEGATLNAANLAIIPLCDTAPGSVGWLDYDCTSPPNLSTMISDPCNGDIPIPAWLQAQTGNPNCCEGDLNEYTGDVVGTAEEEDKVLAIPIHRNTCREQPANDDPTCENLDEEWSGNGDNLYYYVDFWIGFKLDKAYTQGGDVECRAAPGSPPLVSPTPPGKVGCLKGWLVSRYTGPGSVSLGAISPGSNAPLQIVLVN